MKPDLTEPKGPTSYQNWRAYLDEKPMCGRAEFPFYSDVDFSVPRSEDMGPYRFQHAFAAELRDPALILFVDDYLPNEAPQMERTRTDSFTGASFGDEIAALLSLSLGRRFVAGDATRTQSNVGTNEWIIMGDQARPSLFRALATRMFGRRVVLPRADARTTVTTEYLSSFPKLKPDVATSLVRAARLYRDALWIAEAEPELAWLLFVSALEVAAVQQHVEVPLIDILRLSKPKLVARLEAIDVTLAEEVAAELARELRATARFLGFMERFMPPAPELRPPEEWARLDWSPPRMKKLLESVYKLRSLALHEGMPFPPPMCSPPSLVRPEWPAPIEVVLGLASAASGGVWMADELPMSLHTFEYIARGALLKWWTELARPETPS